MVSTDELFKLSNAMADYVAKNEEGYVNYLKTASFTRNYSVSNQLLIQSYLYSINGQLPRDVRDVQEWNKLGISVMNDTYPIYVMEHDPTHPKSYKPREVYDISQTNAQGTDSYDKGFVVEALLLSAPCPIEFAEKIKVKGTRAIYHPDSKKIEVTKGFRSMDEIVSHVSREYAHCCYATETAKNKKDNEVFVYPRAVYNDMAYAASFVVSNAYGIDTSLYKFSNVISSIGKFDTNEIKRELNRVIVAANSIMNNLDKQLDRVYGINKGDVINAR